MGRLPNLRNLGNIHRPHVRRRLPDPNTLWEEVNTSFVVQLLKTQIAQNEWRLRTLLARAPFTVVRDTTPHRSAAEQFGLSVRPLKRTYRFTAAEISDRKREIPEPESLRLGHVPKTNRAMQRSVLNRLGVDKETKLPARCDMITAERDGGVVGFVTVWKETGDLGLFKAVDEDVGWCLLFMLVRLRLTDESKCVVVCLALLDEEVRERMIESNGSFLYSISVAAREWGEDELVIEIE